MKEPATAQVVAPVADSFLEIKGKPEAGAFVEHLSFKGLTFRHSRYLLPPQGHGDSQAAVSIPAVIVADGATARDPDGLPGRAHGDLRRLVSPRLHRLPDRATVRCVDLGAGAVRIGEHRIASRPADWTDRITMDNCIVRGGGRIFPGCVGV